MQQVRRSFPLLSLPELPLRTVIRCLGQDDRLSLAAVCRTLAVAVSAATDRMELTVTYDTGWEGLCKVLATNTMTCKAMRIHSNEISDEESAGNNAVLVLLKPELVPECTFKGIKQLEINAHSPCLLPPNVARLLPDLEELSVCGKFQANAYLQPLPYCSSLRKLTYEEVSYMRQLPSRYHTAEDLRTQLPNIDTLILRLSEGGGNDVLGSSNCLSTMLRAWGKQLTQLEFDSTVEIPESLNLQQCTRLQSLTFGEPVSVCLDSIPTTLTTLELVCERLEEEDLPTILQFPFLRVFSFMGFYQCLEEDWSQHPCTWHQLDIGQMDMSDLGKIPLHSLKGEGCLRINVMILPDPDDPDGLADVEHAAQCVSNAGLIVEGVENWFGGWNDGQPPDFKDGYCAAVFRAATRVVQPCSKHYIQSTELTHYPQTLTAQIRWLSPVLQKFDISSNGAVFETPPWFWQELQCCPNLQSIQIEYHIRDGGGTVSFRQHITMAAQYLLAVTGRPLMLTFMFEQDARVLDTQAVSHLIQDLQQDLPSCVKLVDLTVDRWHMVVKLSPSVLQ